MKVGIEPRKSSKVCIFTAAFCWRKCAYGKTERQRSIVVESSAYTVASRSTPRGPDAYHPLGEDQLACVHALLSSRDPNGIWTANRPKKVQVEKSTNRVYPSDKARVARADRNRNRTAVNGRYGRDRGEGLSDRVRD